MIKSILLFLFTLYSIIDGEKIQDLSFEGPFTEIDYSGDRMVSRMWRTMGSTVVNNNFVRLTNDRQSKKGALWSRRPLGVSKMSAILKFRISGKGREFFGDGLALWIVTQGYYVEGDVHGFTDSFTGIGIVFDTFKNVESLDNHRDITVLINNGEKTFKMMTKEVQGCNINVRYHTERADFNAEESQSRAKFLLTENSIDLFIDAKNSGEWTRCVSINDLKMPFEWLQHSHIGISASTGQLADNHDVISLLTYSDVYKMEVEQQSLMLGRVFQTDKTLPVDKQLIEIETAVEDIIKKTRFLDHHIEHELASIGDQIDHLDSKVENLMEASSSSLGVIKKPEHTDDHQPHHGTVTFEDVSALVDHVSMRVEYTCVFVDVFIDECVSVCLCLFIDWNDCMMFSYLFIYFVVFLLCFLLYCIVLCGVVWCGVVWCGV